MCSHPRGLLVKRPLDPERAIMRETRGDCPQTMTPLGDGGYYGRFKRRIVV